MVEEVGEDILSLDHNPVDRAVVRRVMLYGDCSETGGRVEKSGIKDIGELETLNLATDRRTDKDLRIAQAAGVHDTLGHGRVFRNVILDGPIARSFTMSRVAVGGSRSEYFLPSALCDTEKTHRSGSFPTARPRKLLPRIFCAQSAAIGTFPVIFSAADWLNDSPKNHSALTRLEMLAIVYRSKGE